MDGMSNVEVYNRMGMEIDGLGINCGIIEWVKRNTLRWFGHVERMQVGELAKRIYTSEVEGTGIRGRPPASWKCVVDKYVRDRIDRRVVSMENVKQMCLVRDAWRRFCRGHHLEGVSQRR